MSTMDLTLGAKPTVLRPIPTAMRPLFLKYGCAPWCQVGIHNQQGVGIDIYHDNELAYTIPWSEIEPQRIQNEDGAVTFKTFPEGHNPWRDAAEVVGAVHR